MRDRERNEVAPEQRREQRRRNQQDRLAHPPHDEVRVRHLGRQARVHEHVHAAGEHHRRCHDPQRRRQRRFVRALGDQAGRRDQRHRQRSTDPERQPQPGPERAADEVRLAARAMRRYVAKHPLVRAARAGAGQDLQDRLSTLVEPEYHRPEQVRQQHMRDRRQRLARDRQHLDCAAAGRVYEVAGPRPPVGVRFGRQVAPD